MAGRIPDHVLEDILGRVDIVEVISGYLPLKRAGRNYKANCPFHQEKTASFTVSSDKQIFHCFGCGESGNAFGFLMRYEHMEFPEAVRLLAGKTGVAMPDEKPEDKRAASLAAQLYEVNEIAAHFYSGVMGSAAGVRAREYLKQRGIDDTATAAWGLGFAPESWDAFITHARAKGVPVGVLEKAGLISSREGGGYYDRFRNRLIFPILDVKGRVTAFGARVLDDSLPKYLNSPETPVYVKGRHLYGLAQAKVDIREKDHVVVVEGYLDCVLPHLHGVRTVVASLGTALTEEQVRLLKRYTHNAVMVYDPDTAGQIATLRSLDIFIEEEVSVGVVSLPKGHDPDLFVRTYGAAALEEKIAGAETLFDYKLRVLKARYGAVTIEAKAKVAGEMLFSIAKFKNAVLRSEYVKRLAGELRLDEDALRQELSTVRPCTPRSPAGGTALPQGHALPAAMNLTEKLLVQLMLEEKALIERIRQSLDPGDFQDERIARIVALVFDLHAQGASVEPRTIVNHLQDGEAMRLVCESALPAEISPEQRERVICDCISRLKRNRITHRRRLLQEQIKVAQHEGDEGKIETLMREFHGLLKTKVNCV